MKIVALVGSLRKDSSNMQLVKTIKERYSTLFDLEIADIGILPYYNEDNEIAPPREVEQFKRLIEKADAVLISSPEYNWSISGVLKNALEWLSRVDKVIVGKPVLPMGVSQGALGTVRAQLHLRQVLGSIQANTMPPAGNEILITLAHQKINDERLIDEDTLGFIDQVMVRFIQWVKI